MPEERKVMREPLPSTSQDYSSPEISCHSGVPPCNRASALTPRFPLFSSKIALFLFSLLMTTAQKRACRKRDQNYSFPAKLLFAYCKRRGFRYFIGWRLFLLTYLSDKACNFHKSLEGENSHSFFRESPSSLNKFIGYVELTDFREIWPELALMTKEQKYVSEFLYFDYFSPGGL